MRNCHSQFRPDSRADHHICPVSGTLGEVVDVTTVKARDRKDMKHTEKVAPIAASLSALATLACCLPIAFAAGTATASLAVVAGSYRRWFIGVSGLLLLVGAAQVVRARRTCGKKMTASIAVLAVSGAIVLLVVLFPQLLAGFIADYLP